LGELLQELRILQQGALVLTGFLSVLPFNAGFSRLPEHNDGVYVATFLCALASLILLTAPAAHHRLARPLRDRPAFKRTATRLALVGLGFFSLALVLATYLIVSAVLNDVAAVIAACGVGVFILVMWWLFPWLEPWYGESRCAPTWCRPCYGPRSIGHPLPPPPPAVIGPPHVSHL
jgi:hypothetical protein